MSRSARAFDFESLARKYNIKSHILNKLVEEAKREFPDDEMMVELHVVRAIRYFNKYKM